jgi:hypothetical protein
MHPPALLHPRADSGQFFIGGKNIIIAANNISKWGQIGY